MSTLHWPVFTSTEIEEALTLAIAASPLPQPQPQPPEANYRCRADLGERPQEGERSEPVAC